MFRQKNYPRQIFFTWAALGLLGTFSMSVYRSRCPWQCCLSTPPLPPKRSWMETIGQRGHSLNYSNKNWHQNRMFGFFLHPQTASISFALSTFARVKNYTFSRKITHLPAMFLHFCKKYGIFTRVQNYTSGKGIYFLSFTYNNKKYNLKQNIDCAWMSSKSNSTYIYIILTLSIEF